jgi:DHA2 family multidrug resistance protein-like MFS transporter
MAGCMLAPQTVRWWSRPFTMACGMVIIITGILLLTQLNTVSGLFSLITACTLIGFGCGFVVTLGHDVIVSAVPQEQAGAASGISETSTTFGSAFGVALLGSIGTAAYRTNMSETSLVSFSEEANSTLSGALTTAKQLPVKAGFQLIDTARTAFVQSFVTVSIVAAILIFMVVILFSIIMRRKSK